MTGELISLLAIAASLAIAAMAALFKLMRLSMDLTKEQTTLRHALRNELTAIVQQSENRITSRLERLERLSNGFQRHNQHEG